MQQQVLARGSFVGRASAINRATMSGRAVAQRSVSQIAAESALHPSHPAWISLPHA
jgi:hypothetical protein